MPEHRQYGEDEYLDPNSLFPDGTPSIVDIDKDDPSDPPGPFDQTPEPDLTDVEDDDGDSN